MHFTSIHLAFGHQLDAYINTCWERPKCARLSQRSASQPHCVCVGKVCNGSLHSWEQRDVCRQQVIPLKVPTGYPCQLLALPSLRLAAPCSALARGSTLWLGAWVSSQAC